MRCPRCRGSGIVPEIRIRTISDGVYLAGLAAMLISLISSALSMGN